MKALIAILLEEHGHSKISEMRRFSPGAASRNPEGTLHPYMPAAPGAAGRDVAGKPHPWGHGKGSSTALHPQSCQRRGGGSLYVVLGKNRKARKTFFFFNSKSHILTIGKKTPPTIIVETKEFQLPSRLFFCQLQKFPKPNNITSKALGLNVR